MFIAVFYFCRFFRLNNDFTALLRQSCEILSTNFALVLDYFTIETLNCSKHSRARAHFDTPSVRSLFTRPCSGPWSVCQPDESPGMSYSVAIVVAAGNTSTLSSGRGSRSELRNPSRIPRVPYLKRTNRRNSLIFYNKDVDRRVQSSHWLGEEKYNRESK